MRASGSVLGIDYGERRIGLAVSDAELGIAFPVGVHERAGLKRDLAALSALVVERGIRQIVVGLPIHMDGRVGPEAEAARRFAHALGAASGVPVELLDERWTTREAERAVRESGAPRKRRRAPVDALAATLILRTYLERENAEAEGAE